MHSPGKDEWLPRRLSSRAALKIALALLLFQLLALGQQKATEDQVKAAYLLNFAKLAEFPTQFLPDDPSPLVIGVSGGSEEFLDVLKSVVARKTIETHPLVVKSVSSVQEMKSCHIVFFRTSERKHTQAAISALAQSGVLFVGEDESFLRQGGMINLVQEHGSVRFEVNAEALDHAEIHFSSKILALAKAGSGAYHAEASAAQVAGARQIERSVEPEYPTLAGRMKLSGTVQVQAVVKPNGTVKEVNILGGHPLLAAAVATAVMHWKYQPASKETLELVKFTFAPR